MSCLPPERYRCFSLRSTNPAPPLQHLLSSNFVCTNSRRFSLIYLLQTPLPIPASQLERLVCLFFVLFSFTGDAHRPKRNPPSLRLTELLSHVLKPSITPTSGSQPEQNRGWVEKKTETKIARFDPVHPGIVWHFKSYRHLEGELWSTAFFFEGQLKLKRINSPKGIEGGSGA